ncbi:unnamed protein product [Cylicocyclus nassatus]|uniref:C2H2-type domain-containing protein n=1 Tax=Cylicocyclus nassatus TaxID=53992 RepID=A0AA36H9R0_CYLNA|nr:unnamed protein product [Cylicocyclus nassatus]
MKSGCKKQVRFILRHELLGINQRCIFRVLFGQQDLFSQVFMEVLERRMSGANLADNILSDYDDLCLENLWTSPIIGEDIFLTEPYKCTERCICRRTPFQESSYRINSNVPSNQSSQVSMRSAASWASSYFDHTFTALEPPPAGLRSASWDEVFARDSKQPNGQNIKEIFVNDRHLLKPGALQDDSDPPKPLEPRQKFQRFRQKKFVCDECDRLFTMKQNVQQHFFQYHNPYPNGVKKKPVRTISKRFQCTKCNKIFKTLEKAQRHEARQHGETISPSVFVCPHCSKVYNAHSQLKEHVDVVHENLRPFKCEHCDMVFGRAGGLRRHDMMALTAHIRSVHTKDRPFKCLYCERTFVRKNDLKVHETTHSTQSEYVCKKCNSSFRRSIYLQKHEKRCTGEQGRRSTRLKAERRPGPLFARSNTPLFGRSNKAVDGKVIKEEPMEDDEEEYCKGSIHLPYFVTAVKSESVICESPSIGTNTASVCEGAKEKSDTSWTQAESTIKTEPLEDEDGELSESVVKTEPLEDGELSETTSIDSVKAIRDDSSKEKKTSNSRKRPRRAVLKLPRKPRTRRSTSRNRRNRRDVEKTEPSNHTSPQKKKEENAVEKESSEQKIVKEESKKEEVSRKRLRYEPREEAVAPRKRERPVVNVSFLSRVHSDLDRLRARRGTKPKT